MNTPRNWGQAAILALIALLTTYSVIVDFQGYVDSIRWWRAHPDRLWIVTVGPVFLGVILWIFDRLPAGLRGRLIVGLWIPGNALLTWGIWKAFVLILHVNIVVWTERDWYHRSLDLLNLTMIPVVTCVSWIAFFRWIRNRRAVTSNA